MTDNDRAPRAGESDDAVARRIAIEAAELLVEVRAASQPIEHLDLGERRSLGDRGDEQANRLILERLAEVRPGDAVLSEEAPDDLIRVERSRVWIVDPLDGTAEYRAGRDEFAVHIALWESDARGPRLTAATIALPDRHTVRSTGDVAPVMPPLSLDDDIRLVVSRSHVPRGTDRIIERLTQLLRHRGHVNVSVTTYPVGSVGAKVDEVMAGRAAAYLFSGGLKEWDAAAPFAVAEHAGFVVRAVTGSGFDYNRPSPVVGSGFVAHPELAELLTESVVGSGL